MSMPFYVSPEQLMKDRADFARKGIARGRSVACMRYADGILFVSENPSHALHKVSEIYDRIASQQLAATTSSRIFGLPGSDWQTCVATPTTGVT
ncbi:MAG: hypothetical protein R2709_03395 [Marmoricola sp.]